MEQIKICAICGMALNPAGLSTVIITDRHKKTSYYHEECIQWETKRHKKGIETYENDN